MRMTAVITFLLLFGLVGVTAQAQGQVSSTGLPYSDNCFVNTTLAFIVDTSQSVDMVADTMRDALDLIGDNSYGAVLSFVSYHLWTWKYLPPDFKTYPAIQDLTVAFHLPSADPDSVVGNIRINDPDVSNRHNDWAYMLDSLSVAVEQAQYNGVIVVLGDQDELCDGRQQEPLGYNPRYNNTLRNLLIAPIIAKAVAKSVRISFYYFIMEPAWMDPNGCPADPTAIANRAYPMSIVEDVAAQTGGFARFNSTLAAEMAHEVKIAGKRPAVCDDACVPEPSLGFIVDTSGSTQQISDNMAGVFQAMGVVSASGALRPFGKYFVNTYADPANIVHEFPTFPALVSYMSLSTIPNPYANLRYTFDLDAGTQHNDWFYMIQSLAEMVNHVGAGGYIVVIADQEQMCDVPRFAGNIYSGLLQNIINQAIAKHITLSYYSFADGNDGAHIGFYPPDCNSLLRFPAEQKADATTTILNGQAVFDIDTSTPAAMTAASQLITNGIVHQSLRIPCSNCTVNATLSILMDTSASADPLKLHFRHLFTSIAALPPASLFGWMGGFLLNTFAVPANDLKHFTTAAAMQTYANTFVPVDPLETLRFVLDPLHSHDDWQYMLETLVVMVPATGKDGVLIIVADDNQICDAGAFLHTAAEFAVAVTTAVQLHITIHYFAYATPNRWCTHAAMAPGHALATQLATATGGTAIFNMESATTWSNLTAQVLPVIALGGQIPVCPLPCPAGSVWAGDHCLVINPCLVRPCQNGGTCSPTLYTSNFQCQCDPRHYGWLCQYECIDHSTADNLTHALGLVIDTSDGFHHVITGVIAAVSEMMSASGYFDSYVVSSYAYNAAINYVKTFTTSSALMTELQLPATAGNGRKVDNPSGDDWKYMYDSVEKVLPLLGDNSVLIIAVDAEQLCDANPAARLDYGLPRFPYNPNPARANAIHAYALLHKIKVFYFTFPASDYGYCSAPAKILALNMATGITDNTGGITGDLPVLFAQYALDQVKDQIATVLKLEGTKQRCPCPPPLNFNPTLNICAW